MSRATRRLPAALLLGLVPALAAPVAWAEMPPGISHFTLDNGMEAVVIEDHRAPVVVQMVWYKIGSADETPGKTGLAHYLEHLMFKGTDTLEPGELSKTVTANGGMDNAFTSYDFTAYFQRIAADRLPLIMEMEADRMANLRIGEDDWQAERQVVLEERAQRTDSDPAALFGEERAAVQFYNHPYGRPVIGWREEMMGLTRQDALDWYDSHYAPNQAVLVVAGDVTPEEVRQLAEEHYGPIPPKPDATREARPQEPVQRAERRMEMSDPRVPQPVLSRSIIAPERNPGDQKTAAALTVLADLLGGSPQTSVLGKALMLSGKAVYAGARYDGLSVDPTTFSMTVVPAPGVSQDEAERLLEETLSGFLEEGPDPAALGRVRTRLRAERIYERDSAHARAYDYGQGLSIGLTVQDVNDWPDLLAEVTAEDVRQAAALVLGDQPGVTSWLLPAPGAQLAAADVDPAAPVASDPAAVPVDASPAADAEDAEASPVDDTPSPGTPPAPHAAVSPKAAAGEGTDLAETTPADTASSDSHPDAPAASAQPESQP
ncbi:insulinase family protein [uncultured Paracoccus sp.]|uniref:M16 family metallopeptidase n=1 Tax=uncultured Paracoccus sp. TaxID=189685 RepID=UPI00260287B1|nr:insulinase family protein [uncultured Paracoccus sp.]